MYYPLFYYFYYYFLDTISKEMKYIWDPADFSVPLKKEHLFAFTWRLLRVFRSSSADAEAILADRYADFMKIPPKEQRLPHYSTVEFYDE